MAEDIRILAEQTWVITAAGRALHHPARIHEPSRLAEHNEGLVATSCGYLGDMMVPAKPWRTKVPRCRRCCRAVGYREGTGSPVNDEACRERLEKRLREIGAP